MKNLKLLKFTAGLLVFVFLFSDLGRAAPQFPNLQMALRGEIPQVSHIDIPPELATVDEVYEAPSPDPRVVLHIQDAHANYEAQMRIKDLLKYLNQKYGFKIIFAEGAAEELDPKYLQLAGDPKRNTDWIEELAREGELSGAELYLSENAKAMRALPIEEVSAYRKNYLALRKVFDGESIAKSYLSVLEMKMDKEASRIFSPAMQEALKEWGRFEKGQREFLPYLQNLAKLAKAHLDLDFEKVYSQMDYPQISRLLVLQRIEKEMDVSNQASSALTQAIEEKKAIVQYLEAMDQPPEVIRAAESLNEQFTHLNRIAWGESKSFANPRQMVEMLVGAGLSFREYPNFMKYAGYLILRSEIQAAMLSNEIEQLFTRLLDRLVQVQTSDQDKCAKLLELFKDEALLKKLLNLELNRQEWKEMTDRKSEVAVLQMVTRTRTLLGGNAADSAMPEPFRAQVESLQSEAYAFYEAALARESVFFRKMGEELDRSRKAVLVTGGFHTEGLKELFREKEISYGILTPRITQIEGGKNYRKAMMNPQLDFSASTLQKALAAQDPAIRAAMFGISAPLPAASVPSPELISTRAASPMHRTKSRMSWRRMFAGASLVAMAALLPLQVSAQGFKTWTPGYELTHKTGDWKVFAGDYRGKDTQTMLYEGRALPEIKVVWDTREGHAPQFLSINANGSIRAHPVSVEEKNSVMGASLYLMRYFDKTGELHANGLITKVNSIRKFSGKLVIELEMQDRPGDKTGAKHWSSRKVTLKVYPPDEKTGAIRMDIDAEIIPASSFGVDKSRIHNGEALRPFLVKSNNSGPSAALGGGEYYDSKEFVVFGLNGKILFNQSLSGFSATIPDTHDYRFLTASDAEADPDHLIRGAAGFALVNSQVSPVHLAQGVRPPTIIVIPAEGLYDAMGLVTRGNETADNLDGFLQPAGLEASQVIPPGFSVKGSVYFVSPGELPEEQIRGYLREVRGGRSEARLFQGGDHLDIRSLGQLQHLLSRFEAPDDHGRAKKWHYLVMRIGRERVEGLVTAYDHENQQITLFGNFSQKITGRDPNPQHQSLRLDLNTIQFDNYFGVHLFEGDSLAGDASFREAFPVLQDLVREYLRGLNPPNLLEEFMEAESPKSTPSSERLWSYGGIRSEARTLAAIRADLKSRLRDFIEKMTDLGADSLSELEIPDVFSLAGDPDLKTYIEFAKKWKALWRGTRIVLTGGKGRGTLPLLLKVKAHYKIEKEMTVRGVDGKERVIDLTGIEEKSFADYKDLPLNESELMDWILRQEGIPQDSLFLEKEPSSNTAANYQNTRTLVEEVIDAKKINPIVVIVKDPSLVKRGILTAQNFWPANWTVKGISIYDRRMSVDQGDDQVLLDMLVYYIGLPKEIRPEWTAVNRGNEVRGMLDALSKISPGKANETNPVLNGLTLQSVADMQKIFIEYMAALESEGYPITENKLARGLILNRSEARSDDKRRGQIVSSKKQTFDQILKLSLEDGAATSDIRVWKIHSKDNVRKDYSAKLAEMNLADLGNEIRRFFEGPERDWVVPLNRRNLVSFLKGEEFLAKFVDHLSEFGELSHYVGYARPSGVLLMSPRVDAAFLLELDKFAMALREVAIRWSEKQSRSEMRLTPSEMAEQVASWIQLPDSEEPSAVSLLDSVHDARDQRRLGVPDLTLEKAGNRILAERNALIARTLIGGLKSVESALRGGSLASAETAARTLLLELMHGPEKSATDEGRTLKAEVGMEAIVDLEDRFIRLGLLSSPEIAALMTRRLANDALRKQGALARKPLTGQDARLHRSEIRWFDFDEVSFKAVALSGIAVVVSAVLAWGWQNRARLVRLWRFWRGTSAEKSIFHDSAPATLEGVRQLLMHAEKALGIDRAGGGWSASPNYEVIEAAIKDYQARDLSKPYPLRQNIDFPEPEVFVLNWNIHMILWEILKNAKDAYMRKDLGASPEENIFFEIFKRDDKLVFEISDDGIGFAQILDAEGKFAPESNPSALDTTGKLMGGKYLGLFLARTLVKAYGGELKILSPVGLHGHVTTVRIILPDDAITGIRFHKQRSEARDTIRNARKAGDTTIDKLLERVEGLPPQYANFLNTPNFNRLWHQEGEELRDHLLAMYRALQKVIRKQVDRRVPIQALEYVWEQDQKNHNRLIAFILFHDIGKQETAQLKGSKEEGWRFKGHEQRSYEIIRQFPISYGRNGRTIILRDDPVLSLVIKHHALGYSSEKLKDFMPFIQDLRKAGITDQAEINDACEFLIAAATLDMMGSYRDPRGNSAHSLDTSGIQNLLYVYGRYIKVQPNPVIVKNKKNIRFNAATYSEMTRDLSREAREKLEESFLRDLVAAVSDFLTKRAGEDILRDPKKLTDDLRSAGFFESPEFIHGMIRRYLLEPHKLQGMPRTAAAEDVPLDVNIENGPALAQQIALMENAVEEIIENFADGHVKLDREREHIFYHLLMRFYNSVGTTVIGHLLTFSLASGVLVGLTHLVARLFDFEPHLEGFAADLIAGVAISRFFAKKIEKKVERFGENWEEHDRLLSLADKMQGIHAEQEQKRFEQYIKEIKNKYLRENASKPLSERLTDLKLLQSAKQAVLKTLPMGGFRLAAYAGHHLAMQPNRGPMDMRSVVLTMLAEVAHHNEEGFERLRRTWGKHQSSPDLLLSAVALSEQITQGEISRSSFVSVNRELVKLAPLAKILSTKEVLSELAQRALSDQIANGAVVPRVIDGGRQAVPLHHLQLIEKELVAQGLHHQWAAELLHQKINPQVVDASAQSLLDDVIKVKEPEDRRAVIYAYSTGYLSARLNAMNASRKTGRPLDESRRQALFLRTQSWLSVLKNKIIRPEEYGITGENLNTIISDLESHLEDLESNARSESRLVPVKIKAITDGISFAQTQGGREEQQDRVLLKRVQTEFFGNALAMAVFDGHGEKGGGTAAQIVKDYFSDNLEARLKKLSKFDSRSLHEIFDPLFRSAQDALMRSPQKDDGTTVALVIILPGQNKMISVTLGDSPVMILTGDSASHSLFQNMDDQSEQIALLKRGEGDQDYSYEIDAKNYFVKKRKNDNQEVAKLKLSATLGHSKLDRVLIRIPNVEVFDLQKDSRILVASDGIMIPRSGVNINAIAEFMAKPQLRAADFIERVQKSPAVDPAQMDNTTVLTLDYSKMPSLNGIGGWVNSLKFSFLRSEARVILNQNTSLADIAKQLAAVNSEWSRSQRREIAGTMVKVIRDRGDELTFDDLEVRIKEFSGVRKELEAHFGLSSQPPLSPLMSRKKFLTLAGAGTLFLAASLAFWYGRERNQNWVPRNTVKIPEDFRELLPSYTRVMVPADQVKIRPLRDIQPENSLEGIKKAVQLTVAWLKEWKYPYPEVLDAYAKLMESALPSDQSGITQAAFFSKARSDGTTQLYVNIPKVYKHLQTIWASQSQDFFFENFGLAVIREAWGTEMIQRMDPYVQERAKIIQRLVPAFDRAYDKNISSHEPLKFGRAILSYNDDLIRLLAIDVVLEFYEGIRQLEGFLWGNDYFYSAKRSWALIDEMPNNERQRLARLEMHIDGLIQTGGNTQKILMHQLSRIMQVVLQEYARGHVEEGLENYLFAALAAMANFEKTNGREGLDPNVLRVYATDEFVPEKEVYSDLVRALLPQVAEVIRSIEVPPSGRSEMRVNEASREGLIGVVARIKGVGGKKVAQRIVDVILEERIGRSFTGRDDFIERMQGKVSPLKSEQLAELFDYSKSQMLKKRQWLRWGAGIFSISMIIAAIFAGRYWFIFGSDAEVYAELKKVRQKIEQTQPRLPPSIEDLGARHYSINWNGASIEMIAGAHGVSRAADLALKLSQSIIRNPEGWVLVVEGLPDTRKNFREIPAVDIALFDALAERFDLPVEDVVPVQGDPEVLKLVQEKTGLSREDVLVASIIPQLIDHYSFFTKMMMATPEIQAKLARGIMPEDPPFEFVFGAYLKSARVLYGLSESEVRNLLKRYSDRAVKNEQEAEKLYRNAVSVREAMRGARNEIGMKRMKGLIEKYPGKKFLLSVGYNHAAIVGVDVAVNEMGLKPVQQEDVSWLVEYLSENLRRSRSEMRVEFDRKLQWGADAAAEFLKRIKLALGFIPKDGALRLVAGQEPSVKQVGDELIFVTNKTELKPALDQFSNFLRKLDPAQLSWKGAAPKKIKRNFIPMAILVGAGIVTLGWGMLQFFLGKESRRLQAFYDAMRPEAYVHPSASENAYMHQEWIDDWNGFGVDLILSSHTDPALNKVLLDKLKTILKEPSQWILAIEGYDLWKDGALAQAPDILLPAKAAELGVIPIMDPIPTASDPSVIRAIQERTKYSLEEVVLAKMFSDLAFNLFWAGENGNKRDAILKNGVSRYVPASGMDSEALSKLFQARIREAQGSPEALRRFSDQVNQIEEVSFEVRDAIMTERLVHLKSQYPSRKKILVAVGYRHAPPFGFQRIPASPMPTEDVLHMIKTCMVVSRSEMRGKGLGNSGNASELERLKAKSLDTVPEQRSADAFIGFDQGLSPVFRSEDRKLEEDRQELIKNIKTTLRAAIPSSPLSLFSEKIRASETAYGVRLDDWTLEQVEQFTLELKNEINARIQSREKKTQDDYSDVLGIVIYLRVRTLALLKREDDFLIAMREAFGILKNEGGWYAEGTRYLSEFFFKTHPDEINLFWLLILSHSDTDAITQLTNLISRASWLRQGGYRQYFRDPAVLAGMVDFIMTARDAIAAASDKQLSPDKRVLLNHFVNRELVYLSIIRMGQGGTPLVPIDELMHLALSQVEKAQDNVPVLLLSLFQLRLESAAGVNVDKGRKLTRELMVASGLGDFLSSNYQISQDFYDNYLDIAIAVFSGDFEVARKKYAELLRRGDIPVMASEVFLLTELLMSKVAIRSNHLPEAREHLIKLFSRLGKNSNQDEVYAAVALYSEKDLLFQAGSEPNVSHQLVREMLASPEEWPKDSRTLGAMAEYAVYFFEDGRDLLTKALSVWASGNQSEASQAQATAVMDVLLRHPAAGTRMEVFKILQKNKDTAVRKAVMEQFTVAARARIDRPHAVERLVDEMIWPAFYKGNRKEEDPAYLRGVNQVTTRVGGVLKRRVLDSIEAQRADYFAARFFAGEMNPGVMLDFLSEFDAAHDTWKPYGVGSDSFWVLSVNLILHYWQWVQSQGTEEMRQQFEAQAVAMGRKFFEKYTVDSVLTLVTNHEKRKAPFFSNPVVLAEVILAIGDMAHEMLKTLPQDLNDQAQDIIHQAFLRFDAIYRHQAVRPKSHDLLTSIEGEKFYRAYAIEGNRLFNYGEWDELIRFFTIWQRAYRERQAAIPKNQETVSQEQRDFFAALKGTPTLLSASFSFDFPEIRKLMVGHISERLGKPDEIRLKVLVSFSAQLLFLGEMDLFNQVVRLMAQRSPDESCRGTVCRTAVNLFRAYAEGMRETDPDAYHNGLTKAEEFSRFEQSQDAAPSGEPTDEQELQAVQTQVALEAVFNDMTQGNYTDALKKIADFPSDSAPDAILIIGLCRTTILEIQGNRAEAISALQNTLAMPILKEKKQTQRLIDFLDHLGSGAVRQRAALGQVMAEVYLRHLQTPELSAETEFLLRNALWYSTPAPLADAVLVRVQGYLDRSEPVPDFLLGASGRLAYTTRKPIDAFDLVGRWEKSLPSKSSAAKLEPLLKDLQSRLDPPDIVATAESYFERADYERARYFLEVLRIVAPKSDPAISARSDRLRERIRSTLAQKGKISEPLRQKNLAEALLLAEAVLKLSRNDPDMLKLRQEILDFQGSLKRGVDLAANGDVFGGLAVLEALPAQLVGGKLRERIAALTFWRTEIDAIKAQLGTVQMASARPRFEAALSRLQRAWPEVTWKDLPFIQSGLRAIEDYESAVGALVQAISQNGRLSDVFRNAETLAYHYGQKDRAAELVLGLAREALMKGTRSGYQKAFYLASFIIELSVATALAPEHAVSARNMVSHAMARYWLPELENDAFLVAAMVEAMKEREDENKREFGLSQGGPLQIFFSSLEIHPEKRTFTVTGLEIEVTADDGQSKKKIAVRNPDRVGRSGDTFLIRNPDKKNSLQPFFRLQKSVRSPEGKVSFTFELPETHKGYEYLTALLRGEVSKGGILTRVRPTSWEKQRAVLENYVMNLRASVAASESPNFKFDKPASTGNPLTDYALGLTAKVWPDRGGIADPSLVQKIVAAKAAGRELDPTQAAGISEGLQSTGSFEMPLASPVVFYQGPPGTGKTTVIEWLAELLTTKRQRVVILAQSNAGADNVAEKLLPRKLAGEIQFARVGSSEEAISEAILPIWERRGSENGDLDQILKAHQAGEGSLLIGTINGFSGDQEISRKREALLEADVLIIDEASLATLPEFFYAYEQLRHVKRIIVVGDPQQLPAFGLSEEDRQFIENYLAVAQKKGRAFMSGNQLKTVLGVRALKDILSKPNRMDFKKSYFEKMLDLMYPPEGLGRTWKSFIPYFFLNVQRRSGKRIVEMIDYFYRHLRGIGLTAGRLESGVVIDDDTRGFYGYREEDAAATLEMEGKINRGEADRVISHIFNLMNQKKALGAEDIGVISPYQAQVELIRDNLMEISKMHAFLSQIRSGAELSESDRESLRVLLKSDVVQTRARNQASVSLYRDRSFASLPAEVKDRRARLLIDQELGAAAALLMRPSGAQSERDAAGQILKFLALDGKFVSVADIAQGKIDVTTVDSSQGSEYRALIISWVRSNRNGNVGFLADPIEGKNRRNVAISRAQDYLIMVWDHKTFLGAEDHEIRAWAQHMIQVMARRSEARFSKLKIPNKLPPMKVATTKLLAFDPSRASMKLGIFAPAFHENGESRIVFDRVNNYELINDKRYDFGTQELVQKTEEIQTPRSNLIASAGDGDTVLSMPGGNLGSNDWYIALQNGKVYFYAKDQLKPRTMLVQKGGRLQLMEMQFKRLNGRMRAFDAKGENDITDSIPAAVYGLPILRGGEVVIDQTAEELEDLRHLLRMPLFDFEDKQQIHLGMSDSIGDFYADRELFKRAIRGEAVTLSYQPILDKDPTVTAADIRRVYRLWGYPEIQIDEEHKTVTCRYNASVHPHTFFGFMKVKGADGKKVEKFFVAGTETGLTHYEGVSLKQIAEDLKAQGATDVFVWVNGKDTQLISNGKDLLNVTQPRGKLPNAINFIAPSTAIQEIVLLQQPLNRSESRPVSESGSDGGKAAKGSSKKQATPRALSLEEEMRRLIREVQSRDYPRTPLPPPTSELEAKVRALLAQEGGEKWNQLRKLGKTQDIGPIILANLAVIPSIGDGDARSIASLTREKSAPLEKSASSLAENGELQADQIGIVGLGTHGQRLLTELLKLEGLKRVNAVARGSFERVQKAFSDPRLNLSKGDASAVLTDKISGAVIIASPAKDHYAMAKQALENNKHVFVEKPFTLNTVEAEELVRMANDRHRILMVGHTLLYAPHFERLKAIVESGKLGKIISVDARLLNPRRPNLELSSTVTEDLGYHDLYMIQSLLEGPELVPEIVSTEKSASGETATVNLKYGEIPVHMQVSREYDKPIALRAVTVKGEKFTATFNHLEFRIEITPTHPGDIDAASLKELSEMTALPSSVPLPLGPELKAFVQSVQSGVPPVSSGESALGVVRLIEKIEKNLNTKRSESRNVVQTNMALHEIPESLKAWLFDDSAKANWKALSAEEIATVIAYGFADLKLTRAQRMAVLFKIFSEIKLSKAEQVARIVKNNNYGPRVMKNLLRAGKVYEILGAGQVPNGLDDATLDAIKVIWLVNPQQEFHFVVHGLGVNQTALEKNKADLRRWRKENNLPLGDQMTIALTSENLQRYFTGRQFKANDVVTGSESDLARVTLSKGRRVASSYTYGNTQRRRMALMILAMLSVDASGLLMMQLGDRDRLLLSNETLDTISFSKSLDALYNQVIVVARAA